MGRNFFGILPDSVSSLPEIFRSLTLFLWERHGTEVKKAPFFNIDFEGLVWALTQPPAKTPPNLAGTALNFFDTLPGSLSSAPEIFRPLTLFLWVRRGTEFKKAPSVT